MISWILIALSSALVLYTYLLYPLALRFMARPASADAPGDPAPWPLISITIPVYNEVGQIRETVDSVLGIDYPADRRQILFVSDASTDGTDEVIREYADRGVELLRMSRRGGKTAAENAARARLRGEIVVNTDASIRIHPDAVKALVRQFSDATVGVATGRDVSKGRTTGDGNLGESGYVGYEMWVRDLETRAGGIVGASGSLYAIRRELHERPLPEALSRDFASALVALENGFRAVSVPEALCVVPRTDSLPKEYRRKVRTMTRGMETLHHKSYLLNPLNYGRFSFMLFSHKICRWLVPWALVMGLVGVALLDLPTVIQLAGAGALLFVGVVTALVWLWPLHRPVPSILSIPAFATAANAAAIAAALRAARGEKNPLWEPTRRPAVRTAKR